MSKFWQRGFSVVEVVIVIVVVGLIAFVGYIAYQQLSGNNAEQADSSVNEEAQATDVGEAPAVESSSGLDAAATALDDEDLDSLEDLKSLNEELSEF